MVVARIGHLDGIIGEVSKALSVYRDRPGCHIFFTYKQLRLMSIALEVYRLKLKRSLEDASDSSASGRDGDSDRDG